MHSIINVQSNQKKNCIIYNYICLIISLTFVCEICLRDYPPPLYLLLLPPVIYQIYQQVLYQLFALYHLYNTIYSKLCVVVRCRSCEYATWFFIINISFDSTVSLITMVGLIAPIKRKEVTYSLLVYSLCVLLKQFFHSDQGSRFS